LTRRQQALYDWIVDYFRANYQSPSIKQMVQAMGLRSNSGIQSRLTQLRKKGYLDWDDRKARTIRLLEDNPRSLEDSQGIPILGVIAAGYAGTVDAKDPAENNLDDPSQWLAPAEFRFKAGDYALRVRGDSMIDAMIKDGDLIILRPTEEPQKIKPGSIVAALVGDSTTLKYFHPIGDRVQLRPANPNYPIQEFPACQVRVQGKLVTVWRNYA
ncbi:MAG: transcriptional repressor LexA, partial [Cyanobacteria bacterium J06636_16]